MWSEDAHKPGEESGEGSGEEEEEEDDEEGSDDDAGPSRPQQQELSREDRKKAKKAQKDAAIAKKKKAAVQVGDMPTESEESSDDDDDMPANPNHTKSARNQAKATPGGDDDVKEVTEGVDKLSTSRRPLQGKSQLRQQEAEAKEAQFLADEGERLAEVRKARAEAAARRAVRDILPLSFTVSCLIMLTILCRPRRRNRKRSRGSGRPRKRQWRPSCVRRLWARLSSPERRPRNEWEFRSLS